MGLAIIAACCPIDGGGSENLEADGPALPIALMLGHCGTCPYVGGIQLFGSP